MKNLYEQYIVKTLVEGKEFYLVNTGDKTEPFTCSHKRDRGTKYYSRKKAEADIHEFKKYLQSIPDLVTMFNNFEVIAVRSEIQTNNLL